MKQLKIGLVLDDTLDTPDGVQQYVLTLGKWFSEQGHDVHYLVGESTRSDLQNMHSLSRNIGVRFNGNRMSMPLPTSRTKLRKFLQEKQFDVLHVQMPYSPWLAHRIMLAAPRSVALIGTFHIMPYSQLVRLANHGLGLLLGRSLKRLDAVFAVSSAAKEFAMKAFRLQEVGVLPNVTDEQWFRHAKPLPQYDDNVLTIMFLGRLVPRKGCATLLEAVTILKQRKQLPKFRVVICGKGPLEVELKQYVADQRLEEIVTFAGFVPEDEKARYVASADIMAFPSSGGESFGIVLIEALASARPVVLAGDNPGYHAVMSPRPDLLFPATSAFDLANKLTTFLRGETEREQTLRWQSEYAKQFDVEAVGTKLLKTYADACAKHTT
jgi:phosphatidylinositol alpha-mannosyltransferase